jgi:hypothetical protein
VTQNWFIVDEYGFKYAEQKEYSRADFRRCRLYPDYTVNAFGEVRNKRGKQLRYHIDRYYNYVQYKLNHVSGKRKTAWCHRLVADAFIACVDDMSVDHIDTDQLENHALNLRIMKVADNIRYMIANKKHKRGQLQLESNPDAPF